VIVLDGSPVATSLSLAVLPSPHPITGPIHTATEAIAPPKAYGYKPSTKTNADGSFRYVYSSSAVSKFLECERKWAFWAVEGIEEPEKKAARLGTEIHDVLEHYLKGQGWDFTTYPVAAKLAARAAPHLPLPGTRGLVVEGEWSDESHPRHAWAGRIDWFLVELRDGRLRATVGDHKSTSSIAAWAKSVEVLAEDTQATLYAWRAFRGLDEIIATHYPEALAKGLGAINEIDLQWTYIQTKGEPKVDPRRLAVRRSDILERMSLIDGVAESMTRLRESITKANQAPKDLSACENFGGCHYGKAGLCEKTTRERLIGLGPRKNGHTMAISMLERIKAKQAAEASGTAPTTAPASAPTAPATAPAAPQSPPSAPATAPKHSGLSALAVRDGRGHVTHAITGGALPPSIVESQVFSMGDKFPDQKIDPLDETKASWLDYWAKMYAATPDAPAFRAPVAKAPEAPTPPAPPIAPTPPKAPETAADWRPGAPSVNPPDAPSANAPTTPATTPTPPTPDAATPSTGRRGRPKGSKNKSSSSSETKSGDADGLTLYLDCAPHGEEIEELSDVLAEVRDDMLKGVEGSEGVLDHSMIDYKGAGFLAVLVEEKVRALPKGSELHAETTSREWIAVGSRVIACATRIVRAHR
jgi:hypothetical protein